MGGQLTFLQMDCDEIPFESLPELLQFNIYEKFTFKEYATFEGCSNFSQLFCQKNCQIKFSLKVRQIMIRTANTQMDTNYIWMHEELPLADYAGHEFFELPCLETCWKSLFSLENVPNVCFEADNLCFEAATLCIKTSVYTELLEFITRNVKSVNDVCFPWIKIFPTDYYQILTKIQPNCTSVLLDSGYEDVPTEFENIPHVRIASRLGLDLETALTIKAKHELYLYDVIMTNEQFISKISEWQGNSDVFPICRIYLIGLRNFNSEIFSHSMEDRKIDPKPIPGYSTDFDFCDVWTISNNENDRALIINQTRKKNEEFKIEVHQRKLQIVDGVVMCIPFY